MKNLILGLLAIMSFSALASSKIDLSKANNLVCETRGRGTFLLLELQSEKPKYKGSSEKGIKINILKIDKSKLEYEISSRRAVEAISIKKTRKNEEGETTLIGILSDDMGNESLVECSIID